MRTADSDKSATQSSLKSLEKDILEIEEKLRKDEGRKAKIQEELDNLARQRDNAIGEVNKFHEDQEKLSIGIKEEEAKIENANEELQKLRNETEIKQQDIRKLKEEFIHKTALKGELNRVNIRLEK